MNSNVDNYYLIIKSAGTTERIYPINKDVVSIGRDLDNDIPILDNTVSRRHALITRKSNPHFHMVFKDLGSLNHSYINNERVTNEVTLKPGDVIRLARNVFLDYVDDKRNLANYKPFEARIVTEPDEAFADSPSEKIILNTPMKELSTRRALNTAYLSRVFISYSHADKPTMWRVHQALEQANIPTWVDQKNIPLGGHLSQEIETAIENCRCVVVILSPDAKKSAMVRAECAYAAMHEKTVLPLLAEGEPRTAIPADFVTKLWIDIRNEAQFNQKMEELITRIRDL